MNRRSCEEPSVEVEYQFDLRGRNRNTCQKEPSSRLAIAQQQGGSSPAAGMTLSRPGSDSNVPGGLHPHQDF